MDKISEQGESFPQKCLTIITHHYNNDAAVRLQLQAWRSYPPEILARINIIMVDDCSDQSTDLDFDGLPVRLFRVETDIDWNMGGCRNLAAREAETDWLLFHDVDHVLEKESAARLVAGIDSLDAKMLYKFVRIENGVMINSHVNSFLLQRAEFWQLGGYDEDFSGHYGYEDIYLLESWKRKGLGMAMLTNVELHHVVGAFTPNLDRDLSRNHSLMEEKLRNVSTVASRPIRFEWREIFCSQAASSVSS